MSPPAPDADGSGAAVDAALSAEDGTQAATIPTGATAASSSSSAAVPPPPQGGDGEDKPDQNEKNEDEEQKRGTQLSSKSVVRQGTFKYGRRQGSSVSLRGSEKAPIRKKSGKLKSGADPVAFPLDALVQDGVPCLAYDEKEEKFQMRVLRLDEKFYFLYLFEKESPHATAKKLPSRIDDAVQTIRFVSVQQILSGEPAVTKCLNGGLAHDLLGKDTAVVLEFDPRGISDEQLGTSKKKSTATSSPLSPAVNGLRKMGSRVAEFFGGSPTKSQRGDDDPPELATLYLMAGPKQNLAEILKSALASVDFQQQATDGARLVQGLFRIKRMRRTIKQMSGTKIVDKITVLGGEQQMLQQVYADEMKAVTKEDVVEITFKNTKRDKPFTFTVTPEDWHDGVMTELARKIASAEKLTVPCRERLARFLHECQLFYLAMRKFDPVAVEFFVEDKKQLQNRVPFSVLNTMEEDVAQLKESFAHQEFGDRRIEAALTRVCADAFAHLVRLERTFADVCPGASVVNGIDLVVDHHHHDLQPSLAHADGGGTVGGSIVPIPATGQGGRGAEGEALIPKVVSALEEGGSGFFGGHETTTAGSGDHRSLAPVREGIDPGGEQMATEYDLSSGYPGGSAPDLKDVLSAQQQKKSDSSTSPMKKGGTKERDGLPCCACREGMDDVECCVM